MKLPALVNSPRPCKDGVHSLTQITAWKPNLAVSQFGSIEEMHDNVHDLVGTDQNSTSTISGNMSSIEGSAFDPIF